MALYTVENTAAVGFRVFVYLDGVEQNICCEADTEKGYVICAKKTVDGKMYLDGDEVATETRWGDVRVYPSTPRLSPDGKSNICDQCGKEWRMGQGPDCGPCRGAWARIDAAKG